MDFIINGAILHVLDYEHDLKVFAQESVNLDDKIVHSYINRQLNHARNDVRSCRGQLKEESFLIDMNNKLKNNEINFVDYSLMGVNEIDRVIKDLTCTGFDILVIDYSEDDYRKVAFILLESQQAFTHHTLTHDGFISNSITKQNSLLPSPNKKVNAFVLVDILNNSVELVDEINWNSGDIQVLKDLLIKCDTNKSQQQVIEEVVDIASDVALSFDENPTVVVSKVKNYIQDTVVNEKPFVVEEMAKDVFEDKMYDAFVEKTSKVELPTEIEVNKSFSTRKMKNQKIKTNTGIELTFPTAYFENNDYIEIQKKEDGKYNIVIKNIDEIINKG